MSTFLHKLNMDVLTIDAARNHPWFLDLLRKWQPSGFPKAPVDVAQNMPLRLGIRNGYLNFYAQGQSIAKVAFQKRQLKGEIHHKYVDDAATGQKYVNLDQSMQKAAVWGDLETWIGRSKKYHGREKTFVDLVVAANETVIDLEMGLPAYGYTNPETGKKVAPRIDLVALEAVEGGWQVVFWEAKLISDGRICSNSPEPEVIKQIRNYKEWFERGSAKQDVLHAYRETCLLLKQMHDYATSQGISAPPLAPAIVAIAADPTKLLTLDPIVRLIVDARSYDKNTKGHLNYDRVHLPKMQALGVRVHTVRDETPAGFILPTLSLIEKEAH